MASRDDNGKFAHYRLTPGMAVEATRRGYRVADEDWLDVVERHRPANFDGELMLWMRKRLDPSLEGRGRPSKRSASTVGMIRRLKGYAPLHFPEPFVQELGRRLAARKRYNRGDEAFDYVRRWRLSDRNMFIRGLYQEFYDLLDSGSACVEHKILGSIEVPLEVKLTRHEKALEMAHHVMRERMNLDPPSTRTMLNIIVEGRLRKRPATS